MRGYLNKNKENTMRKEELEYDRAEQDRDND